MKLFFLILSITTFSCIQKEQDEPKTLATLTCYSGEKIIYQTTTEPIKIQNPSGESDEWIVYTDNGKVEITADCIYTTN